MDTITGIIMNLQSRSFSTLVSSLRGFWEVTVLSITVWILILQIDSKTGRFTVDQRNESVSENLKIVQRISLRRR